MTETNVPAGDDVAAGGDLDASSATTIALPARLRVHALARALSVTSRQVLTTLEELGLAGRSAQSSIVRDEAERVVGVLAPSIDVVATDATDATEATDDEPAVDGADAEPETRSRGRAAAALTPLFNPPAPVFIPPPVVTEPKAEVEEASEPDDDGADDEDGEAGRRRRRRGRRGRGRGRGGQGGDGDSDESDSDTDSESDDDAEQESADSETDSESDGEESGGRRRRRRRRRKTGTGDDEPVREDDPPNTVVHVREPRSERERERDERVSADNEVQSVRGSTRLEAKRQRRRDGREAGRRRAPILSESEFLTRRESVERTMVVREFDGGTQIGVLEDGVLCEHFVTTSGTGSIVGNIYLGRVQNVLPSMEAAFVDIGRGRNAVLYAGEVDWDAAGLEGKGRKIEQALSSGDSVLVQVTKDPIGHKGARLTTQISLPGRFLVYVPGGRAAGISRKLPDTERKRLKDILKRIVPDEAGVVIRTASEGIAEEELARDVRRLQAQWEVVQGKADGSSKSKTPELLYEEPDLLIKVVRDLFTEDFAQLVVQGDDAWDTVEAYVKHVAPDLMERINRANPEAEGDVFTQFRIDEQIMKALDRKVWLPSGGYLIIDRTEAMTVIDVNTGKFTGSGGNLEETVTRNNLEAAEEVVRQLRLRDVGGIIVIDFIDMVLESNRDLVLRRLTECLGRDRTRHQVAEVTSLGLVQMTRKKVGTGLLEAFSTNCEHCKGRGVMVSTDLKVVTPAVNGSGGGSRESRESRESRDSRDSGESGRRTRGRGRGRSGGSDRSAPEPEVAEAVEPETVESETTAPDEPLDTTPAPEPEVAEVVESVESDLDESELDESGLDESGLDESGLDEVDVAEVQVEDADTGAAEAEQSAADAKAEAEAYVQPKPVTPRPRRRRAASRPAGPPTHEQRADRESGSEGAVSQVG